MARDPVRSWWRNEHREGFSDEWHDSDAARAVHASDPQSILWATIGRQLYLGRKRFLISKREAARRAEISEALWRMLEGGGKQVGGQIVLPNPRPENLYAACTAVEVDPQPIFEALGQELPEQFLCTADEDELAHRISHLSDRDRHIIRDLVESMIRAQASDSTPPTSDG